VQIWADILSACIGSLASVLLLMVIQGQRRTIRRIELLERKVLLIVWMLREHGLKDPDPETDQILKDEV
jgi:hypothetical protein